MVWLDAIVEELNVRDSGALKALALQPNLFPILCKRWCLRPTQEVLAAFCRVLDRRI